MKAERGISSGCDRMAFRTASSEGRRIRAHDFRLRRFTRAFSNAYRQTYSLSLKKGEIAPREPLISTALAQLRSGYD
jgi:hypothetical protein